MTNAATVPYATWHIDPEREVLAGRVNAPMWRHFIETLPECDFTTKTVLDFGCSRGGFLRLLHTLRPFRFGVGVDLAEESIAAATAQKGDLPLQYEVATDLSRWQSTFDTAFSYEVLYLMPDLAMHAGELFNALRDGGVYYAVTGGHTESPLWPSWREKIAEISNAPVQDYSPEDIVQAFVDGGFDVSLKRFGYNGFVSVNKDRSYYPSLTGAVAYPLEHKLMFRFEKRAKDGLGA